MPDRLILHIGMNKTGSTSIQRSFQPANEAGVRFLEVGPANHSWLMTNYALSLTGRPALPAPDAMDWLEPWDAIQRLKAALDDPTPGTLIISAEYLSALVTGDAQVAALSADLLSRGTHVDVIAYIRDPISYMRSAMQQGLRHSGDDGFAPQRYYPQYRQRFERWITAMGAERVHLLSVQKDHLCGGDLLEDFARRVGLSRVPQRWPAENRSLSAEGFAVLYAFRRQLVADLAPAQADPILQRAAVALSGYGQTPFEIAPEFCAGVVAQNHDDVLWIEAQMQRRFPPYTPRPGAIVFDSEADILDLASRQAVSFEHLKSGALSWPKSRMRNLRRGVLSFLRGT